MNLFAFRTGGKTMGIDARFILRVLEGACIAPVCRMPPYHLGMLHHRGELFDVIDVGLLLGGMYSSHAESRRLILLHWSDKKLALAPGVIHGLVWIEAESAGDALITRNGTTIHILTPEQIWKRVLSGSGELRAERREQRAGNVAHRAERPTQPTQ